MLFSIEICCNLTQSNHANHLVTYTLPLASIADKITANSDSVKLEMRPYVIRSKYSSPASLPLFFYVGFQLRDKNPEHQKVPRTGT